MLSGVRTEEDRAGGFYTLQSLLYATALPIEGLHLEMELLVHSVHGEIRAESL